MGHWWIKLGGGKVKWGQCPPQVYQLNCCHIDVRYGCVSFTFMVAFPAAIFVACFGHCFFFIWINVSVSKHWSFQKSTVNSHWFSEHIHVSYFLLHQLTNMQCSIQAKICVLRWKYCHLCVYCRHLFLVMNQNTAKLVWLVEQDWSFPSR